jgi:23S rRNA pseudoU1915 N3-methylase RlmH
LTNSGSFAKKSNAAAKQIAGKEADSKHLAQQLDELEEFRQEVWLFNAAAKRIARKEADSKHLAQELDELEEISKKSCSTTRR